MQCGSPSAEGVWGQHLQGLRGTRHVGELKTVSGVWEEEDEPRGRGLDQLSGVVSAPCRAELHRALVPEQEV